MKIAIPVESDKSTIARKTGQSAFFAVYENGEILEYIPNRHGHGGAHKNHEHMQDAEHTHSHKKDVMGLVGCELILVQVIGENMKEALESIGLKVKKIRQKHGSRADEVIKKFMDNSFLE
ncbi:MAG: NifB/NifX family molybdenum-iron cluster-binding protein [Campylobacterota bacterium]|nr:NifB/NifX family molybdenum-iron cluster-binding protein [Campylobacterota bacterium]